VKGKIILRSENSFAGDIVTRSYSLLHGTMQFISIYGGVESPYALMPIYIYVKFATMALHRVDAIEDFVQEINGTSAESHARPLNGRYFSDNRFRSAKFLHNGDSIAERDRRRRYCGLSYIKIFGESSYESDGSN
jgi:hypothetical protein